MRRAILMLAMLLLISFMFFGCGPKIIKTESELDQLFEKNFEGLEIPETNWIKEGESKSFPYTTYDQVWDSTILVLMQQGLMIRASKDTGIIIIFARHPLAIYVENDEDVTVYLNLMYHLYKRVDKSETGYKYMKTSYDKKMMIKDIKMAKTFFDKLSTQVYAGDKWKWLKVEGKE